MAGGLIIDLFAGGGGASTGLEAALGRPVDIGINHDPIALAVHKSNHPATRHLEADIWEVRPLEATGGLPVDVLWASPDCTHFSIAKGDVPKKQEIRSLAWAVVRWAKAVQPAVIFVENVQEFRGWGPLGRDGRPQRARMGVTFLRWRRQLERLGYVVDHKVLDASRYGAPTRRRRLFIVARRDGLPIRWPEPTHGPGLQPLVPAAACIDWSLPCPSIFERPRPLAEKTLWRIAQGIRRFVLDNPRPFIVKVNHGGCEARVESIGEPLTTVTAMQRGHGLVVPVIAGVGGRSGQSPATPGNAPVGTITAKGDRALVIPSLVEMNHSNRPHGVGEPLGVVTTQGNRFNLVAPTLVQTGYGEHEGQAPRAPGLAKPLGTVVACGQKHALVAAFIAKHFGDQGQRPGSGAEEPLATITAADHNSLAAATLIKLRGECNGADVEAPMPTVTACGQHIAEVRAFLTTYYSSNGRQDKGQNLRDPARTIPTHDHRGLVTVEGLDYEIVDIGMRMLQPHELLAAQFGRFASAYDLAAATTKAAKVRLIGNSVCPELVEALVAANLPASAAEVAA